MSENTTINPIHDLVGEAVKNLQALLATLQGNSELQQGIRATIDKLTAKTETKNEEKLEQTETSEETDSLSKNADAENDEPEDSSCFPSSSPDFSDGDVIATLALGFAAGAAVVGGGILLHKLLSD